MGRAARALLAVVAPFLVLTAPDAMAATKIYSSRSLLARVPGGGELRRTLLVPDAGPVSYLSLSLRVQHPRAADLTISLRSPTGRELLVSATRGDGPNLGEGKRGCDGQLALFESRDGSPLAEAEAPFTATSYAPEQPFSRLYGTEASGRWTLRIEDEAGGGDGVLLCWRLVIARDVVEVERARKGATSAELLFKETDGRYRDVRVRVRRGGRTALTHRLRRVGCGSCPTWRPLVGERGGAVRVLDLDGGGESEVLVDLYTGGAHCCAYTLLYRFDRPSGRYRKTLQFWGNAFYRLDDLDRDGRPELVSSDDRFASAFTPYAFSLLPIQIWRLRGSRLEDTTRSYPGAVGAHARELWRLYRRMREGGEVRGILAAYLADEALLEQENRGWLRLERVGERGELGRGLEEDGFPAGARYLAELRRFLRRTGYL